jgi:hypothetical protein
VASEAAIGSEARSPESVAGRDLLQGVSASQQRDMFRGAKEVGKHFVVVSVYLNMSGHENGSFRARERLLQGIGGEYESGEWLAVHHLEFSTIVPLCNHYTWPSAIPSRPHSSAYTRAARSTGSTTGEVNLECSIVQAHSAHSSERRLCARRVPAEPYCDLAP